MPTTKKRINLTVHDDLDQALEFLAKRDDVPVATKAIELITYAIEISEDEALQLLASKRDTISKNEYLTHENTWK